MWIFHGSRFCLWNLSSCSLGQGGPVDITEDEERAPWDLSPTYPTWLARGKGLDVLFPPGQR